MQQLGEPGIYTQPERRAFVAREQENTKLVEQIYEHFKRGDIKALLNLLSVNIEWQLPEIEDVPFAGKHRGHEEMGQFFESLVGTQEFQHFDPREFIARDDKVLALGHYACRVKSTGREFGGDFAHVFTVHDGKVVRFHEYMDTAAVAAAHRKDHSAEIH
jgi:ketosteroid isomerase-like protein